MKMRGTCKLRFIDYTIGEGLFWLPVMRYLILEKRWTDKGRFCMSGVSTFFLLFLIIKIKRVMISHTATMTSQISESEKEDRSSMKIVIIESPLSLCGMHKSRRASFNNPFTSVIHRKIKKPHLKMKNDLFSGHLFKILL